MELRDLIVTPIVIISLYVVAYIVRPWVTDDLNRRYFLPALTMRIVGALALGFLYQFYYQGGDTFNFHTHGSRHIWEAFMESPIKGIQLLFSNGDYIPGVYQYTSRIPFYTDPSSYTVIRIAAFFDLFTFSAYSATAIFFAAVGFTGSWMLFITFYSERPQQAKVIAWATLFIPSVIFWGSGLLKDTLTLAAIGFATFYVHELFIRRRFKIVHIILLIVTLYVMYAIKKYILLCYLPSVFVWVYARTFGSLQSVMLKILVFPVIVLLAGFSGMVAIEQVGKDDPRYALQRLGNTAKETAYDIAFQTGREAGSTYSLGTLDGSFGNLLRLAPEAINVSLFRPYLWEVRNPLMLMSAFESFALLILTLFVIYKARGVFIRTVFSPDVIFSLMFSITFAFAVGVSTYNFGTLSRYKIPLLPFYILTLIFIYDEANKERKLSVLERTEY